MSRRSFRLLDGGQLRLEPYGLPPSPAAGLLTDPPYAAECDPPRRPEETLRAALRSTMGVCLLGMVLLMWRPWWTLVGLYTIGLAVVGCLAAWAALRPMADQLRRYRRFIATLLEQPAIRDYAEGLDLPTVEEVTMGNL